MQESLRMVLLTNPMVYLTQNLSLDSCKYILFAITLIILFFTFLLRLFRWSLYSNKKISPKLQRGYNSTIKKIVYLVFYDILFIPVTLLSGRTVKNSKTADLVFPALCFTCYFFIGVFYKRLDFDFSTKNRRFGTRYKNKEETLEFVLKVITLMVLIFLEDTITSVEKSLLLLAASTVVFINKAKSVNIVCPKFWRIVVSFSVIELWVWITCTNFLVK